ncbi:MAG: CinA family protein [Deltaproteobacteria bacterium]|nr:CinA family protein [Deltaproteobacteria bacterium]
MKDLTAMTRAVGELLKTHKHTVAVAESSTGGLIAAALLAVPGASAFFLGGGVIYTLEARRALLALPDEALAGVRPSTEEYALRLARTIRQRLGTTWGLAESGATGPTGNRYGDPPGHSCIGITGPVEKAFTVETGQADREANMWVFTQAALELLEASIKESL